MAARNPCQAIVGPGIDEDGEFPLRCYKYDHEKPQAFRGTDWCSENHRKLVYEQRGLKDDKS